MKVLRKQEIETANIQVGDQVIIPLAEIGEFSATAHKVTDEGIMFIFDEYIKYIPMLLGAGGIVLCGIWVLATSPLGNGQEIAMAVFTAIVQGILMAGLSNYVNQIIKQANKNE